MPLWHSQRDEAGRPVPIHHPSTPTPLENWLQPDTEATVVPGGLMPRAINGVPFTSWHAAPTTPMGWIGVPGQSAREEPPQPVMAGKSAASGVVIAEPDGRFWLISPTNAYGGYQTTFPKGRCEVGLSLQANAIKEAFEETGLQVAITACLGDFERSTTLTRYYYAKRTGGHPGEMGWETQAVHLAPKTQLADVLTHPNDKPLLKCLLKGVQ